MTESGFKREIKLFDAIMIVAGTMIGSGIFIVSSDIARNVGSSGYLLLIWVVTGFITIAGALSYGELAGMFPKAGGQYVYLREAWGKPVAFLYAWTLFLVIHNAHLLYFPLILIMQSASLRNGATMFSIFYFIF